MDVSKTVVELLCLLLNHLSILHSVKIFFSCRLAGSFFCFLFNNISIKNIGLQK